MPIAAHFERPDERPQPGQTARAERRRVLLETRGALASGAEATVVLHNFSAEGVLVETAEALEIGETIDLVLPESPSVRARVTWASGRLHGCAFDEPLHAATLNAVTLRSAVQSEIGLAEAPAPPPPTAVGGETLGERFQRLRKLRGFTQGELAARLGVSKPTVWAWEQGRARPIDERLEAIAEALGVTTADLHPRQRVPTDVAAVVGRCRSELAQLLGVDETQVRISVEY